MTLTPKIPVALITASFLAAGCGSGLFGDRGEPEARATPTSTPTPAATPSPTPEPASQQAAPEDREAFLTACRTDRSAELCACVYRKLEERATRGQFRAAVEAYRRDAKVPPEVQLELARAAIGCP